MWLLLFQNSGMMVPILPILLIPLFFSNLAVPPILLFLLIPCCLLPSMGQFLGCLFLPIRIGVPKPRMQVHAPASCRNSQTEGQMHSFCSAILWKQATALPNGTLRYLISKHYRQTSPCALSWEITIRSLAANTYIRRPSGQKISKAIRARPITGA